MLPIRPMAECFFFFFCKFFFVNSRLRVFSTLKTLVYKICVDYKNGLESNKNIVLNKKKRGGVVSGVGRKCGVSVCSREQLDGIWDRCCLEQRVSTDTTAVIF